MLKLVTAKRDLDPVRQNSYSYRFPKSVKHGNI